MQSRNAVVAKRADPTDADDGDSNTDEIRKLAEAAGHEVVAAVTQTRAEDTATQFGRGKAEELAETVAGTGAAVVAFDNDLTPTQTVELAERCPEGTRVYDRRRLVLGIFGEQVGSKRAKLQVERAKLKWHLPRIRERSDEQAMNRFTESGTRYYDVRDRIDELDRKLSDLGDEATARRERRREEGFSFVALAGYTNAGKSTLLHRLADDLDFDRREADHADLDATAAIEDRLFETLETTTRRATIRDRRTLVTDTVGFVRDLSHDLVASFHGTLSETQSADCVVVVADASDSPTDLRAKLQTSFDLLADAEGEVLTVLNKADLLDADELAEREAAIAHLDSNPIAVSAIAGDNLDALRDRIVEVLPERRETELVLPNNSEAMGLVSWLYDHASVEDVSYDDEVRISFSARDSIIEKAEVRAEALAVEA